MKICLSILLFTSLLMNFAQARVLQEDAVAQVIVLRGEVKGLDPDGVVFDIQKDMWLAEGTVLQSGERSMARLLFIDRSTMNLGPESQMKIDEFPRDKAGIITVMKGQVRSKVTKDYMNMDSDEKSKLFIKTKTAAMGVRGTDFQVNFNPNNENTALITFSGAVAMAQLDSNFDRQGLNQARLEASVSSDRAVMVREGEFSGVTSSTSRATVPTRISPVQFESLKQNDTGLPPEASQQESNGASDRAKYRSPLPPGVDSKSFANDPRQNAARAVGSAVGDTQAEAPAAANSAPAASNSRAPEGFFNASTGEYAPPAGSVVDLTTVNIVPPPKGAAFDPISQTFTLPPEFGGVNPKTGSYEAPEGLKLSDNGQFVVATDPQTGRAPASESGAAAPTAAPAALNNAIASPVNTSTTDLATNSVDTMNAVIVGAELSNLVEETQLEVEQQVQENREQEIIQQSTTTNATFRFSVTE
jgi:hypothetical protein